MACGFGHAVLFPSVVSLGTEVFPREYRGSGTTIILGFTEVGAMISARPLGWVIDRYGFSAMFNTAAGCAVAVILLYALTSARRHDNDLTHTRRPSDEDEPGELAETGEKRDTGDEESIAVPFPQLGRNA
jgi:predicted MFS family arabinose efflux permease